MHDINISTNSGFSDDRLNRIREWSAGYIRAGKLPCAITAIMRRGELAFLDVQGFSDVESQTPIQSDSLFRIFSMTKIITSVAAMMLYEEGHFQLDDPLSAYIPAFKDMQVWAGGTAESMKMVPTLTPITIKHVMTHTAGFTYAFNDPTAPIESLYEARNLDFDPKGSVLSQWVEELAAVPLMFQPGERWNYSVATDVLGHLVEVISGQDLNTFFSERIFKPLNMADTSFAVSESALRRLASFYKYKAGDRMSVIETAETSTFRPPIERYQGGGGLVSTASDYLRFLEMMRNGGIFDDARLLGPKTIQFMTANHLPGDLASMGQLRFGESSFEGVGFGLGVAVMLDPAKAQVLCSAGEYNWGGAASTACWVDPREEISAVYLTQLYPSSTYPLRRELRTLVYQALID
ncbi:MAG: beta-lactamase family protein [Rhodospirillales bacterium]|nr:beta-lactamase family protein [Rhodospirillales bacterium]